MNRLHAYALAKLVKYIPKTLMAKQARCPSGFMGKYVMKPLFSKGNADLNQFIFDLMKLPENAQVLEIGFGPGVLTNQISHAIPQGKCHGLDFSETMLSEARQFNQHHINSGRLDLCHGCSDAMPYESNQFDKVCTANTLYFWQPVQSHFAEVFRVLKPGAQFVMGFRDAEQLNMMGLDKEAFKRYTQEEVEALLTQTGFEKVYVLNRQDSPLVSHCAVAYKPV